MSDNQSNQNTLPEFIESGIEAGQPQEDNIDSQILGNWKIVDLPQIVMPTGEENQEVLKQMKVKVFRFRGEWKQRGVGKLKFLKHKIYKDVRIIVRAEKILKCILNHKVVKDEELGHLEKLKTSQNAWFYVAKDSSDHVLQKQTICLKFISKEDFEEFGQLFENCWALNKVSKAEKQQEVAKNPQKKEAGAQPKKQSKQ